VKHGHDFNDTDMISEPGDWNDAFVTRSAQELRQVVSARRKEQVTVRFSSEVLAYFRATGPGWQTRMDDALREYVAQRKTG
jgi:uncharacterized protein (DUF4415 family)